jgi:hypothetical protein
LIRVLEHNSLIHFRPIFFSLILGIWASYAAIWVFEGAEHDDASDLVVVAGVPKMIECVLNGCLCEDGVVVELFLD